MLSLDEPCLKGRFSGSSAALGHCLLIINEDAAMKLAHIILTAIIAAGAAFAAVAPASAMPADRPAMTAQGDMVQIRDGWRDNRWLDDGDWHADRGWRDGRDWGRADWRDDDRRWRRWRAERWQERREWRRDRDIPFWLYRG
ncbi:hypothetical protein ABID08_001465 [Rhizobium binae]|uniref:Uncharacterized protein n=2 Tax=Rhizobium binae TaxID=1138190 RepID=A0ABV2MCC7_9HYPH